MLGRSGAVLAVGLSLIAVTPASAVWQQYNGHWYDLTPAGLTWTQAEQAAVAMGGHLVTINDAAENAWLLSKYDIPSDIIWIGLHQPPGSPEPGGGWVWTDGQTPQSIGYVNWAPPQPDNNLGIEDSAQMYATQPAVEGGTWNDLPGTFTGMGLVEREFDPAVPAVSHLGLLVLTMLGLCVGAWTFSRRSWNAA
ncbi:MAG: hypothetical protein HY287_12855 [Planctomycetes bacterium]|nr:hypothetical protein [Planctomycetota bacterium]MBI3835212.1 hypothetical protein [Planctomycetota bacterium]